MYYDQWDRLYWWQMVAVLVGIAVLVGGVLIISWQPGSMSSHSADSNDSIEAPIDHRRKSSSFVVSDVMKKPSWWSRLGAHDKKKQVDEPSERTRLLHS